VSRRERVRISADDLAWLGAIVAGLFLVVAFAWITPALSHLYPSPNETFFSAWRRFSAPEPLEDVRGIVTLATPFVVAAGMLLLGSRMAARRSLDPLIVSAQIMGIALLALAVLNQRHLQILIPHDYFEPLLLGVPNLVIGTCIGLAITAVVLRWSGRVPKPLASLEWLAGRRGLALAVAAVATAIFLLPAVVTDATVAHSGTFASSQIPSHAEDYMAVVDGRTPLVNYIGQYASLLPLALEPVLVAFHSSITSFSIAMNVLSALALLAVFGVFVAVTRRPWVALALYVPFLALCMFPWHDNGAAREFNGNYHALFPDRLLGPFLLAWLCALRIRGRRIPAWSLYLLAGLTELNNAEFGTGAIVALTVGLIAGSDRSIPVGRRLTGLAVQAGAGLLAAVAVVSAVTLIRAGSLPDPALLTYYNRLFLRQSFGLLPMPSLGLQWALYATYAAALLTATARYVRDASDRTLTAMLAFTGAFGLVTGMYFVGRSAAFQLIILFPVWALCLSLVAWTAARALRSARADRDRLTRLLLPAAAALIGFGVMVAVIDRVSPPWRQADRLADGGRAVDDTPNAQRFIESHTDPGDRVFIIGTPLDHRIAERAGVTNVSPINGYISLLSSREADRALDQLSSEGGDEVFEAVTDASAVNPSLLRFPELATILRQRGYRLVEQDPSSGLRLWRD
jgi:hypothetical protein